MVSSNLHNNGHKIWGLLWVIPASNCSLLSSDHRTRSSYSALDGEISKESLTMLRSRNCSMWRSLIALLITSNSVIGVGMFEVEFKRWVVVFLAASRHVHTYSMINTGIGNFPRFGKSRGSDSDRVYFACQSIADKVPDLQASRLIALVRDECEAKPCTAAARDFFRHGQRVACNWLLINKHAT